MAFLIEVGEPTTFGEQLMLQYMKQALPVTWYVVGNPSIRRGRMDREIDAIVIGENGVWVVDEKSFGGVITGDENVWILQDGSRVEGVLRKVLFAAKLVSGKIAQKCPELKRRIYVEGVIVLTAGKVSLRIQDESVKHHVCRLTGCERAFLSARAEGPANLSPAELERVLRALVGDLLADQQLRRGTSQAAGGNASPGDRTGAKGRPSLALCLEGTGGFRRVYYEDVLIGRRELRGALPAAAVNSLKGTGVHLRFASDSVTMEPANRLLNMKVGSRMLSPGQTVTLGTKPTSIQIDDIRLRATVMEVPQEGNDENP
jgi:hypothetical protein